MNIMASQQLFSFDDFQLLAQKSVSFVPKHELKKHYHRLNKSHRLNLLHHTFLF